MDISSFQVTYWRTCCTFNSCRFVNAALLLLAANKIRIFFLFLSEIHAELAQILEQILRLRMQEMAFPEY